MRGRSGAKRAGPTSPDARRLVGAGEQTLVAGLTALHALYDLTGPRDPGAVLALDGAGVHITAAERTVAETHSFAVTPHPDIDRLYGPVG